MQCTNNLKQLALACMNYESSNSCLPMHSGNASATSTSLVGAGWIPGILQFTEAVPQYNALNFNLDIDGGNAGGYANSTVTAMSLNVLTCPSENNNTGIYGLLGVLAAPWAGLTNYAGNYGGPGPISMMSGTIIPANNYMIGSVAGPTGQKANNFYPGATWGPVRLAAITDGTSNTGLISEHLIGIPAPFPTTLSALGQANLGRCVINSPTGAPRVPVSRLCWPCSNPAPPHRRRRPLSTAPRRQLGRRLPRVSGLVGLHPLRHAQPGGLQQYLGHHDLGDLPRHSHGEPRRAATIRAA